MNKCIFLDRDGVLNRERGDYTFQLQDFEVLPGVSECLASFKKHGFLLIVVTNQAGISKGLYSTQMMNACHLKLQKEVNYAIDDIFYCRWHPSVSKSLSRKPQTLMFEKACALYNIDCHQSWMIGDRPGDIEAGISMALRTILIDPEKKMNDTPAHYIATDLHEANRIIISGQD
ncbi:MAG: HAD-IIIA family hydrolase [Cyclobacteriaceae bacterium]|nr:HAD-IIIA family hydrolase [Cyclobacteriaceae bacterium]